MGNFISYPENEEDNIFSYFDFNLLEPEEKEPLDLRELPRELFYLVLDKLNYIEYSNMEQTCHDMAVACNSTYFSLPHFVYCVHINRKTVTITNSLYFMIYDGYYPRTPWHVATATAARIKADSVNITYRASGARLRSVTKLFKKNRTSADKLVLTEHITFEPKDLGGLLKTLKVKSLHCFPFLPREFFQGDIFNGLYSIVLNTCGCTDEELVRLKVDVIYMENDFITARGLNRFLKQWKRKEREIIVVEIDFVGSFGSRNFDTILEGLDANPIWTPDIHEHSIISAINLEDFPPMKTGDPEHIYSIFRSDDLQDSKIIRMWNSRFEVFSVNCEAGFLLSYLDNYQYYIATRRCIYCEVEFCCHWRKYSVRRFKKFYPNFYDGMINGLKISRYLLAIVHCTQYLLGSPLHLFSMSQNERARMVHEENPTNTFQQYLLQLRVLLFSR